MHGKCNVKFKIQNYGITKITQALLVASKDAGSEENTEKTKYMVMSREQNAERYRNIQISNKFFESVSKFRYFGTTPTYKNCIRKQIKNSLNSWYACYHSVRNFYLPFWYAKSVNIKM
jgi:hypothetical protein